MKKVQIIQISIFCLIILISYFTYNYLNYENKTQISQGKKKEENQNKTLKNYEMEDSNISNKILDLSYKSIDEGGNIYEIDSVSGAVDGKEKNLLLLKEVNAKIKILNKGIVLINSKNAKYNKLTLNTHFYEDVSLIYEDHNIKSDDLFLKYTDKEVVISNNVSYKHKSNNLMADVINMDLISKISKIYMTEKGEKVKAVIKN